MKLFFGLVAGLVSCGDQSRQSSHCYFAQPCLEQFGLRRLCARTSPKFQFAGAHGTRQLLLQRL